jgi:uncharacterized protein HemX
MKLKQALAGLALTGTLALTVPAPQPALADGAASTRNLILLGVGAAATYMIIQHNRKVHEKYAEDAARQAALQQENNNAWAAFHQEQRAYQQELAANAALKKEIAYQHELVEQQQRQLKALNLRSDFATQHVAVQRGATPRSENGQVALVSYGWGQI